MYNIVSIVNKTVWYTLYKEDRSHGKGSYQKKNLKNFVGNSDLLHWFVNGIMCICICPNMHQICEILNYQLYLTKDLKRIYFIIIIIIFYKKPPKSWPNSCAYFLFCVGKGHPLDWIKSNGPWNLTFFAVPISSISLRLSWGFPWKSNCFSFPPVLIDLNFYLSQLC